MKKMIATVAAMVLTLSMSVTAFAAQSPTLPSTPDYNGSVIMNDTLVPADAVDASGKEVTVIRKEMTAAEKAAAKEAIAKTFGKVDVLSIGDYHVDGASKENPVTLTFKVPAVKAGDEVYVLHNVGNKGTWVKEAATAKNGAVVATFTSFSQMAVVRVAEAQSEGGYSPEYYESMKNDAAAAQAAQTQSTSPKTAETGAVMVMVAGMAACAAVLVLVSRKKRA